MLSEPESEEGVPLSTVRRDKGKGKAAPLEQDDEAELHPDYDPGGDDDVGELDVRKEEDEYDKAFDDFADIDIDFDPLPTTTTTTTIGSRTTPPIPQPPPATRAPLVPVSMNRHSSLTEMLDREPGLPMISELPEREQEFYKSHWRRGADRAEERRDVQVVPQVGRGSAVRKRTGFVKRGNFRGRGRGRGRGKARKR